MEVECKNSFHEQFYPFSCTAYLLDLQQKQVHHWKEHGISVWKQHAHFAFKFYLFVISALKKHGNTCEPVCIHLCRTYVQIYVYMYTWSLPSYTYLLLTWHWHRHSQKCSSQFNLVLAYSDIMYIMYGIYFPWPEMPSHTNHKEEALYKNYLYFFFFIHPCSIILLCIIST
jgi:hypothetical protein